MQVTLIPNMTKEQALRVADYLDTIVENIEADIRQSDDEGESDALRVGAHEANGLAVLMRTSVVHGWDEAEGTPRLQLPSY